MDESLLGTIITVITIDTAFNSKSKLSNTAAATVMVIIIEWHTSVFDLEKYNWQPVCVQLQTILALHVKWTDFTVPLPGSATLAWLTFGWSSPLILMQQFHLEPYLKGHVIMLIIYFVLFQLFAICWLCLISCCWLWLYCSTCECLVSQV